ncbi:transposase (putative), gypsy type [Artemisia annua]|uniref:Transposase (Putative), gypsy type n=1 Tax=Artemisia annua TaxID=35608 RepID=A0A2U1N5Q8_ARTAN|nr:transposase (putative), gypsy type [Artemisia annua]
MIETIDSVTCKLSEKELRIFYNRYSLGDDLGIELPSADSTIMDSPPGKIGLYTRLIEFGNHRIPFSRFFLSVLQYFRVHVSQLSCLGAARISHFEICCRAHGGVPTVQLFRKFYCNGIHNGYLTFEKRRVGKGITVPVCYTDGGLDSLKHWREKFFWVKSSVFPISVPWHSSVSVEKDPPPSNEGLDMGLLEALNLHRVKFQWYPETFLCVVGLSRVYDDPLSRPTFRNADGQDMSLLDIIKSADPFKVKIGERTLAKGEKTLLEETAARVVEPSEADLTLVDHTMTDELKAVKEQGKAGKKRVSQSIPWPGQKKQRPQGQSPPRPLGRKDKEASGSGPLLGTGNDDRNLDAGSENVQDVEMEATHVDERMSLDNVEDVEKEPGVEERPAVHVDLEDESVSAPNEDSSNNLVARRKKKSTVVSSGSEPANAESSKGVDDVVDSGAGGSGLRPDECRGSSSPGREGKDQEGGTSPGFYDSQTVDTNRADDLYSPK